MQTKSWSFEGFTDDSEVCESFLTVLNLKQTQVQSTDQYPNQNEMRSK